MLIPIASKLDLTGVLPLLHEVGQVADASGTTSLPPGPCRLVTDSRQLQAGDVFLAYKGVQSDGHLHIPKAVTMGASLILLEDPRALAACGSTPRILVHNGRAAWAHIASASHGYPERKLSILGVTGTNGKTSTAWMAGELLKASAHKAMTIGTLGAYFDGEYRETTHTTPDPDRLYALLAEAVDRQLSTVVMEVSSHAIVQEKLAPIRFRAGAFTSFSRDHLDFHSSMDEYFAAKWRFFTELCEKNARLVFWDGLSAPLDLTELTGDTWIYGSSAEQVAREHGSRHFLELATSHTSFLGTDLGMRDGVKNHDGRVPFFARHALENFAAAWLLCGAVLEHPPMPACWPQLRHVPGRLERVGSDRGPAVVIDYAHTPDALEKTIAVLRPLSEGKLHVVFGCGGDRDQGKRPIMGEIAERLADRVYVSSDNPRKEDPQVIIDQILEGMNAPDHAVVEKDRKTAIARAIAEADVVDTVLIAGKGHETYQIVGDCVLPFDDRNEASVALIKRTTV